MRTKHHIQLKGTLAGQRPALGEYIALGKAKLLCRHARAFLFIHHSNSSYSVFWARYMETNRSLHKVVINSKMYRVLRRCAVVLLMFD